MSKDLSLKHSFDLFYLLFIGIFLSFLVFMAEHWQTFLGYLSGLFFIDRIVVKIKMVFYKPEGLMLVHSNFI